MSKVIFVANRLPMSVSKKAGEIKFEMSAGGLATGLSSISEEYERCWVGWPGIPREQLTSDDKDEIRTRLKAEDCEGVFLSKKLMQDYYWGFCNKTIWPLFHYFPLRTVFEPKYWEAYKKVNHQFCDKVLEVAEPGDKILVQDYQLMLLPQLIREKMPEATIGFFLHIPFPSFELFRLLPWRDEILNGILGADLAAFHTYDYVRHFLSSTTRIGGYEHTLGKVYNGDRVVNVDAFPMGINYDKFSRAASEPAVQEEVSKIRQKVGDSKIVVSIDRLDYTKGIIERLEAFDQFLSQYPEYKTKVTLIMLAVPSRTGVDEYVKLRSRLEQLVGRVNGEHGTIGWVPVWYLYRSVPFEKLVALYSAADVGLVTPLRDGMNLIAKEFVAVKNDQKGVLILSEMAGAASEMGEALIVNANNKQEIVDNIKIALEMPEEEQIERNQVMQQRLSRYNVTRWANDFLNGVDNTRVIQEQLAIRALSRDDEEQILNKYKNARRRLLLLDYDGTLVSSKRKPARTRPDEEILGILKKLAKDEKNHVVVMSGHIKESIDQWLGNMGLNLVAEHGVWTKEANGHWEGSEPGRNDWKETIRPILEMYTDRTPGSIIEEKEFSLVWHFRRTDPDFSYVRLHELRDTLTDLTTNMEVGVFEGSKVLEIRNLGINKGSAAELWLDEGNWDFILAAGDDYSDEDLFTILPENAYSMKVGGGITSAMFNVASTTRVRMLLKRLLKTH